MTWGDTTLRLRQLLDAVPEARIAGADDVEIADIHYDSREVTPGSLFVAVPSVGGDEWSGGYRFIKTALDRGAVAVALQVPDVALPVPTVFVPDARIALGDLAAAFFSHPSRELQVFAVTGTDGKTTTTFLLEGILAHVGYTTGLIGTVEIKIAGRHRHNADRMTTPESLDLQRLLRAMVDAGVSHVALEASSHALALERLRGCELTACALTNITGDHVEFHGSWDAYVGAKTRLFTEVGTGKPAVLNKDDPSFESIAAAASGRVLSYGLDPEAEMRARIENADLQSTDFVLTFEGREVPVHLPLSGAFNVSNALAAMALAHLSGVELAEVAEALARAVAPPGRLQRVCAGQPFDVLIDYAHTINAFQRVLTDLRQSLPTGGRLIAVFGAAGNRDRAKRPVLARLARDLTDFFFITNEDPFGEPAERIIEEIALGVPPSEEGRSYEREPDRARAIEKALALARRGDTVIILGKGHERSIAVGSQKLPWSDLEAVQRAVEERA